MLTVVHDADASSENGAAGGSLLDEIVRDGARAMLAAALAAEVAAYIDAYAGEVDQDGYRLVVRNGYHQPREVLTAAGAVGVRAPRVNDKCIDAGTGERRRFCSAILPGWARKSPQVVQVLPLLYLLGVGVLRLGRGQGLHRRRCDRGRWPAADQHPRRPARRGLHSRYERHRRGRAPAARYVGQPGARCRARARHGWHRGPHIWADSRLVHPLAVK